LLTFEFLKLNKTEKGKFFSKNRRNYGMKYEKVVSNSNGANNLCNFYYSQLNSIQAPTKPKPMTVHFSNVDQGDSKYIKKPNGDDIFIKACNKGKGDAVVAYLKKQKVDDIEVIISTHPDAGHVGGLDEILTAYKVETVYTPKKVSHTTQAYKDFLSAVKREKLTVKTAKENVQVALKDKSIKVKFIGPVKE
jgi:competence protein ComEC